jgi:DNA relaxase NicK
MLKIWNERFEPIFGSLIDLKHGGRGFRSIRKSITGIQIYSEPINNSQDQDTYISLSIPGNACDALNTYFLYEFMKYIDENYRINVTRLDIAFDHAPFTPKEFFRVLDADKVRTYAKRETFNFTSSPYQPQEEGGKIGCDTVQIGAPQSERKLRVYNKRGYTRVELEAKKKRADGIAKDVMFKDPSYWGELFMGHMRDFIDLVEDKDTGMLVDFWAEFVQAIPRAGLTVTDPREIEKYRLMGWLHEQISPAFSVFLDLYGDDGLKEFYKYGRKKRGERYDLLLQDHDDIFKGDDDDEE